MGGWISLAIFRRSAWQAAAAWLDARYGWISPAFDAVAHQFYEVPLLERIRRPSQLVLVRWHLAIGSILLVVGLVLAPWWNRHGRVWFALFGIGYAIRAVVWICGGNLPLVPGDSCHYLEVSTSVLRGEGPVKHYVDSFFRGLSGGIREGQGCSTIGRRRWTPTRARRRPSGSRGLGRVASLDAEGCRRQGMQLHPQPAGTPRALRLCSPALQFLGRALDYGRAGCPSRPCDLRRLHPAGKPGGAVVESGRLDADRGLAMRRRRRHVDLGMGRHGGHLRWTDRAGTDHRAVLAAAGPLLSWSHTAASGRPPSCSGPGSLRLVCLPGRTTFRNINRLSIHTLTISEYNFSWTVHHYDKGNTLPYCGSTLGKTRFRIVRVKVKSLLLIAVYSTMILGMPVVLGFCRRLWTRDAPGRETDLLVAAIGAVFVLATLKSIADLTQVAQLGRYYLPVFALMLPVGVAGLTDWIRSLQCLRRVAPWLAVVTCALWWADPTWAYDASWLVKRYQLHWPALREAGLWVQAHPEHVPPQARIMTWFPWELRVTTDRTTILMPRNFSVRRIREVIEQYGVTHFLWGSFEPPPYYEINPESWALELEQLRTALGLSETRELYRSSRDVFFPVRLYRIP